MKLKLRIVPLFMTAMFASCSPAVSEQMSKNAFSEYEIVIDNQIIWSEIFKQKEDQYLVFFYSETCQHCHQIMEDVLAFSESEIIEMYYLNTRNQDIKIPINPATELTIGMSAINELFIAGTPTIIEIKNGVVINNIPGKDECLTFLNMLRLESKI